MNELTLFVNKFLKNHDIMYEGNQENDFNKLLQYCKAGINTYDHPDGFCKYDDNVLIIEHFEFDSSYKNKKGGKNRQEIFRTSNVKPNKNDDIQIYHDEIKCDFTIENYINNAKNSLNSHYNKIDDYIETLKKEKIITDTSNVKVLFCIEDTTVLGNIDSKSGKPLYLLYCTEFIKAIKSLTDLDYILCGSSYGSADFTWFTSVSNIDNYIKKQYSANDTKIANLTPHTMMSFVQIPQE